MAKHESGGEPAVLIGAWQINTRQITGGKVGQKGNRRALVLHDARQEFKEPGNAGAGPSVLIPLKAKKGKTLEFSRKIQAVTEGKGEAIDRVECQHMGDPGRSEQLSEIVLQSQRAGTPLHHLPRIAITDVATQQKLALEGEKAHQIPAPARLLLALLQLSLRSKINLSGCGHHGLCRCCKAWIGPSPFASNHMRTTRTPVCALKICSSAFRPQWRAQRF